MKSLQRAIVMWRCCLRMVEALAKTHGCDVGRHSHDRKFLFLGVALLLTLITIQRVDAASGFKHFITVNGDQLMAGNKPFRFISFNVPNLLIIEDNLPFTNAAPWRLPDRFELRDALATVRQMGGAVVRTYSIPVWNANDPPADCSYVLGPGKFNETAFRTLDLALKLANEDGVRLIIPLVNNWKWQGGRGQYAAFRGKNGNEFWTDPQLIADFEKTIHFILTRTNTLTGVRYCDDKTILCWETGNELQCPDSWTRQIAAYIKSLDTNHLVMDGVNASFLHPDSLTDPYADIVTTHQYPSSRTKQTFAQLIRENWDMAKGKKPYVVGEFGFVSTVEMEKALEAIRDTGVAGGLLWSLRFHDRDGGFYWHSEPGGDNLYKAYHWPGSPVGAAYNEIHLMALVRSNAFEVRGLTPPAIPIPAPPELLPIRDPGEISWQGSVGAIDYNVERAPKSGGPWKLVGQDIDESKVQYYPLFADSTVPGGEWYYRVIARNKSGDSQPSNIVGPVKVTRDTFVDNLADFSKVYARQGGLKIKTGNCREAKEDVARVAGNAGDAFVYRLPTWIEGFQVFTFFPRAVADLRFAVSTDGKTYHVITARKNDYFEGVGDYDYWKPVLYHAEGLRRAGKYLKIEMTGDTQIGRVEITHSLTEP